MAHFFKKKLPSCSNSYSKVKLKEGHLKGGIAKRFAELSPWEGDVVTTFSQPLMKLKIRLPTINRFD